jgi:two-component system KDP operon response regulator KdpE
MSEAPKPLALVVDDEVQIRRLLRVCLESDGYRVHEAATGQEAITDAAQLKPDVVLLDLGLPDMDGVVVLKRLREWSRVPVLVLSVRDREEDKMITSPSPSEPANCWRGCESPDAMRTQRRECQYFAPARWRWT